MELKLTDMTIHDLDDVVTIHCEAWRDAYKVFMDEDYIARKNATRRCKWESILSNGAEGKHFLIRCDGTPVGMISMDLPREAAAPGTYEIFGLYILPRYMGKGYGTAAAALAEERIRQMGYDRISLWVLEPNERARRFWEKQGFDEDGTEKVSYYDRPIRLIRYVRRITDT